MLEIGTPIQIISEEFEEWFGLEGTIIGLPDVWGKYPCIMEVGEDTCWWFPREIEIIAKEK